MRNRLQVQAYTTAEYNLDLPDNLPDEASPQGRGEIGSASRVKQTVAAYQMTHLYEASPNDA